MATPFAKVSDNVILGESRLTSGYDYWRRKPGDLARCCLTLAGSRLG